MHKPLQLRSNEAKILHSEVAAQRMSHSPLVMAEFSSKPCSLSSSHSLCEKAGLWHRPRREEAESGTPFCLPTNVPSSSDLAKVATSHTAEALKEAAMSP